MLLVWSGAADTCRRHTRQNIVHRIHLCWVLGHQSNHGTADAIKLYLLTYCAYKFRYMTRT